MSRLATLATAALLVGCATAPPVSSPTATAIPGGARLNQYGYPEKLAPRPTTPAITEADLMTRIYIFADDSMQGRQSGRVGNMKGTDYIARELRRLGVEPAGDNGTYFQALPYEQRRYTERSTMTVGGQPLRWLSDFLATAPRGATAMSATVPTVYGGNTDDTTSLITADAAAGKLVIVTGRRTNVPTNRVAGAVGIAFANLDAVPMSARAAITEPIGQPVQTAPQQGGGGRGGQATATPILRLTSDAAARILGAPLAGMAAGKTGQSVTVALDLQERRVDEYARNVVAVIRGSDPALRNTYVAVGAHNDHVGFNSAPVDHDSLRAFASERLRRQMVGDSLRPLSREETAEIRVNVDSLRRIRPARLDSIFNGADDDGSGSMALLEMAEAIAAMPTKPARSILFVWHTAEEGGLRGSAYFTANPTVPRDSIVAQINIDMIGRGRAEDMPGGGADYVAVLGASRLSTQLGELVTAVNSRQRRSVKLDYRFDGPTTWPGYNNLYGRSDHANYARYNIPIAFFFTGLHQDYHQVTDEPQYIDYPHYTQITNYLHDLVVELGNRRARPAVDKAGG